MYAATANYQNNSAVGLYLARDIAHAIIVFLLSSFISNAYQYLFNDYIRVPISHDFYSFHFDSISIL